MGNSNEKEIPFEELNTRWQEAYQANPHVHTMDEDDSIIVSFALTEDTDSLFPVVPEEQWQIEGQNIDKWIISIVSITKDWSVIGIIEYHEAMNRLEKYFLAQKDGWALIRGLTYEELDALFEGLPRNALKA
ncbi:MAG: DUF4299 domain-containing protein [Ruminococcaceae bacterium]|nr:DUF4299 domain-containing protein [Oscillospiraceae bacterium]